MTTTPAPLLIRNLQTEQEPATNLAERNMAVEPEHSEPDQVCEPAASVRDECEGVVRSTHSRD